MRYLNYGEAILAPIGNRLEYAYQGIPVATEFINTEAGLVQSFSFGAPLKSEGAQKTLIEAGVARRERKHSVDKIAAILILQNFLDAATATAGPKDRSCEP